MQQMEAMDEGRLEHVDSLKLTRMDVRDHLVVYDDPETRDDDDSASGSVRFSDALVSYINVVLPCERRIVAPIAEGTPCGGEGDGEGAKPSRVASEDAGPSRAAEADAGEATDAGAQAAGRKPRPASHETHDNKRPLADEDAGACADGHDNKRQRIGAATTPSRAPE